MVMRGKPTHDVSFPITSKSSLDSFCNLVERIGLGEGRVDVCGGEEGVGVEILVEGDGAAEEVDCLWMRTSRRKEGSKRAVSEGQGKGVRVGVG